MAGERKAALPALLGLRQEWAHVKCAAVTELAQESNSARTSLLWQSSLNQMQPKCPDQCWGRAVPGGSTPSPHPHPGISEMGQAQFQTPIPNALHRTGFHPQGGFQLHLHFTKILLISTEPILINSSLYRGRRKPFLQSPRASATERHLGRMHEWPDCVHFQEGIHMYSSASSSACAGSAPLMSNQSAAGTNA